VIVIALWNPVGVHFLLPFVLQVSNTMAKMPHKHVAVHKAVDRIISTYRQLFPEMKVTYIFT
jgi:hypothetical protein